MLHVLMVTITYIKGISMTIRNVAKAAGVSTATVSRMINDNGFVSKETKEVILKAMKSEGYQLSKFKKRRGPRPSNTAGLKYRNFTMLWTSGTEAASSTTGQKMMLGITESLQALGVNLVIDYINESNPIPQCLLSNNTDGIFLHGPPVSNEVVKLLKERPVIWLLQSGSHDYGDRVQPDHRHVGISSYKFLEAQGCKSVCCISHTVKSAEESYWYSRMDGFLHEARFGKMKCHNIHTRYSGDRAQLDYQIRAAVEIVDQYIKLTPRPDGIFVANTMGPYIHAELKKRGIIPMKDVYMIGGDIDICGQYLSPEPVMIDIQGRQIGKVAVEAMLWRIKHPNLNKMTYSMESEIETP